MGCIVAGSPLGGNCAGFVPCSPLASGSDRTCCGRTKGVRCARSDAACCKNCLKVMLAGAACGRPAATAYGREKPQPLKRLVKSSRLRKNVFRVRRTIGLGRVEEG